MNTELDISVITITYNERENIETFLRQVDQVFQEAGLRGEIIVVDDNSPDGTAEVVREMASRFGNVRLISRFGKFGIASAYERGVDSSIGDIVVTMDADLSHPPTKLSDMIAAVREGYIAAGSRFIPGTHFSTTLVRKAATRIVNFTTKHLVRTGVDDHTSGFIAISREHLVQVRELGGKYAINPYSRVLYGIPLFVLATKLGIPVKEVATPYAWREKGETKLPFFTGFVTIISELLFLFHIANRLRKYNSVRATQGVRGWPQAKPGDR